MPKHQVISCTLKLAVKWIPFTIWTIPIVEYICITPGDRMFKIDVWYDFKKCTFDTILKWNRTYHQNCTICKAMNTLNRHECHTRDIVNYDDWALNRMTSSNGNIFRVTGLLWGISRTKASDVELWCFFYLRLNKRLSKCSRRRWFETPSHSLWRHCNDSPSFSWIGLQHMEKYE